MSQSALDRARAGDEEAFRQLTDPHLRELHLHCYRMLGSLSDAEDLLQETLIAAWRGLAAFAGRSSVRAWLYRIATNRCLNAIRDSRRRPPSEPLPPFEPPEPTRRGEVRWLQPYPDAWLEQASGTEPGPAARYEARESVELAFVTALQQLPPRHTAALLLCDVLGFSTAEAASMLDTGSTAVKGTLQRARASLGGRRRVSGHVDAPAPGSPLERELAERFASAFTAGDVDGVVAMLTDDAWLAMPPAPHEYHGPEAIAGFLEVSAGWSRPRRLRLVPTRANNQPAFGCYLSSPDESITYPAGILVLTLADDRIRTITRFLDGELVAKFGLPDPLPGAGSPFPPSRNGEGHIRGYEARAAGRQWRQGR
jgi:RNA polymerase sigma-70 factor (ECF subfamily)